MRHGRRRGRLGLVQEHRTALIRNLARHLIDRHRIVTTHLKAKETGRFVEHLITIARGQTLHSRRLLIQKLGSGSESYAKRMIETIAPKFQSRNGGYTRVLRYRNRLGDGASLSLLEFSVPIAEEGPKKEKKKKKEPKPEMAQQVKESKKEKEGKPVKPSLKKEEERKEAQKKGGFLSSLRRFLKGDDDKK